MRAKMEELKRAFPDGVDYAIAYDTTPYIRDSIADVNKTLFEAVAVVGLVVLFFLQDWRAMVLPMIDVPVSLIGTFAVMAAFGFSLNNISLFGLVLTIGIVVDDAIVVLENIERQMANGLDPRTATLKAMEEVTGPIMAVGLVLCAVFVPCAFIRGITGQFFRQFAVTITVSTVISAINAITMTPSRAVLIFKADQARAAGKDTETRRRGDAESRDLRVAVSPRHRVDSAHRPCRGGSSLILGGFLTCWWASPALGGPLRAAGHDRRPGRAPNPLFAVVGHRRLVCLARRGGGRAGRLVRHSARERRAGLDLHAVSIAASTGSPRATVGRWASCSASTSPCCWPMAA